MQGCQFLFSVWLRKALSPPYRWHQLIGAPDTSHLIFVEDLLDPSLHGLVPLHKTDVGHVETEKDERLVPMDVIVPKEDDQRNKAGGIEKTVSEEGPPGEREHRFAEQRAHTDHEEDVKDGGTDDGTDTDVVEGYEHTNHARE